LLLALDDPPFTVTAIIAVRQRCVRTHDFLTVT
jgi:hypothetical protein